jgi:CRP/FNR family cyclic AMP-dependent transcriptional regulator
MADILPRKHFRAGRTIFRKGDAGDVAYVIQSGTVEIARQVADQRRVIASLAAGEIFGEMALIDGKPRMADAIAVTDVTVLAIPVDQFENKVKEAEPFIRALLRMFVKNLRVMTEKAIAAEMRSEFLRRQSEDQNAAAALANALTAAASAATPTAAPAAAEAPKPPAS